MNLIKKNCKKHGYVTFKLKTSKKKSWYSCTICLKIQARKASKKYSSKNRDYYKNYQKDNYELLKSLSLYLKMILLAAYFKPE